MLNFHLMLSVLDAQIKPVFFLILQQSTCHSKLEKADILEMTVRYLRGIQRQRINTATMATIDPTMMGKYRSGFVECKNEVAHFFDGANDGVNPDVKAR